MTNSQNTHENLCQFLVAYTSVGRDQRGGPCDLAVVRDVALRLATATTMRGLVEVWLSWCIEDCRQYAESKQAESGWLTKLAVRAIVASQANQKHTDARNRLLLAIFGSGLEVSFEPELDALQIEQKVHLLFVGFFFPQFCRPLIVSYLSAIALEQAEPGKDTFFRDALRVFVVRSSQKKTSA